MVKTPSCGHPKISTEKPPLADTQKISTEKPSLAEGQKISSQIWATISQPKRIKNEKANHSEIQGHKYQDVRPSNIWSNQLRINL